MPKYIAFGVADGRRYLPDRVNGSLYRFHSDPFEAGTEEAAFAQARTEATKALGYCDHVTELNIVRIEGEAVPVPPPLSAPETADKVWGFPLAS